MAGKKQASRTAVCFRAVVTDRLFMCDFGKAEGERRGRRKAIKTLQHEERAIPFHAFEREE